jgi:hypothetical protein
MSSIQIAGDTSGSITLQAPATAGSTTLTLPTTNGTVLTSGTAVTVAQGGTGNGSLATTAGGVVYTDGSVLQNVGAGTSGYYLQSNGASAPTWTAISASTFTSLGTITPTAVNSVSLGSLTLTPYKSLYIVFNNVTPSSNVNLSVSSNNVQTTGGGYVGGNATAQYGTMWLDLGTGSIGGSTANASGSAGSVFTVMLVGGLTNVSTSTTTIYFRISGSSTFTAGGSIVIYGVK